MVVPGETRVANTAVENDVEIGVRVRCRKRLRCVVQFSVALLAERDKVQFRVLSRMAADFLVVNLQVRHRAARLTPPAIATQDLLPEPFIGRRIESQARESWPI